MSGPAIFDADEAFLVHVHAAVFGARRKFPAPNMTLAAAMEEMGEVAKALMDLQAGRCRRLDLVDECVQLAAMALRIATEGDPAFPASLPGDGA